MYFHSAVRRVKREVSTDTHRVVSWLMLEKDELVRELILLLLRSLKAKVIMRRQKGHRFNVSRESAQAVKHKLTPAAGI